MRGAGVRARAWMALATVVMTAADVAAADVAKGRLVVGGRASDLTTVYAYLRPDPFDAKTQYVNVLLCDAPVPPAAVRDFDKAQSLIDADKLHCTAQLLTMTGKVFAYTVYHKRFANGYASGQGASSPEHAFKAITLDAKTASGRAYTTMQAASADNVPFSYDVTFSTSVGPAQ